MLKKIVTLLFLPLVWGALPSDNPANTFTTRIYSSPPPILYMFEQNPYLSLPVTPSIIHEGVDGINIGVPPPLSTYVWELTGFYRATSTGSHTFSLGNFRRLATIAVGWSTTSSLTADTLGFDGIISGLRFYIQYSPRSFQLEKDTYYPVKITYIGGDVPATVYVSNSGKRQVIGREDKHIIKNDSGTFKTRPTSQDGHYDESGFTYAVYLVTEKKPDMYLLDNYSSMELVDDGHLDARFKKISPASLDVGYVTEIQGHFKARVTGDHNIGWDVGSIGGLQIGPGSVNKGKDYFINDQWTVLDSREKADHSVSLSQGLYYPFRLVVLANSKESNWSIATRDPNGKMFKFRELWADQSMEIEGSDFIAEAIEKPDTIIRIEAVEKVKVIEESKIIEEPVIIAKIEEVENAGTIENLEKIVKLVNIEKVEVFEKPEVIEMPEVLTPAVIEKLEAFKQVMEEDSLPESSMSLTNKKVDVVIVDMEPPENYSLVAPESAIYSNNEEQVISNFKEFDRSEANENLSNALKGGYVATNIGETNSLEVENAITNNSLMTNSGINEPSIEERVLSSIVSDNEIIEEEAILDISMSPVSVFPQQLNEETSGLATVPIFPKTNASSETSSDIFCRPKVQVLADNEDNISEVETDNPSNIQTDEKLVTHDTTHKLGDAVSFKNLISNNIGDAVEDTFFSVLNSDFLSNTISNQEIQGHTDIESVDLDVPVIAEAPAEIKVESSQSESEFLNILNTEPKHFEKVSKSHVFVGVSLPPHERNYSDSVPASEDNMVVAKGNTDTTIKIGSNLNGDMTRSEKLVPKNPVANYSQKSLQKYFKISPYGGVNFSYEPSNYGLSLPMSSPQKSKENVDSEIDQPGGYSCSNNEELGDDERAAAKIWGQGAGGEICTQTGKRSPLVKSETNCFLENKPDSEEAVSKSLKNVEEMAGNMDVRIKEEGKEFKEELSEANSMAEEENYWEIKSKHWRLEDFEAFQKGAENSENFPDSEYFKTSQGTKENEDTALGDTMRYSFAYENGAMKRGISCLVLLLLLIC